MPQAVVPRDAGERGQRAAVDPVVGERHQPLVPAAVVPVQRAGRQQRGERVEDRLEPGAERHQLLVQVVVVPRVAGVHLAEEVRRRQLMVVARDHHLMRPDHRADRVGRHDLAGLVEDHQVEQPGGGQHLADHQRGHRPARLQREQHVAGLVEQPAQRQVAAAQRGLLADHPGLQRVLGHGVPQLPGPRAADPGPVGGQVLHVAAAELLGDLVQRGAVLGAVVRVADPDLVQDRPVPGVVERARDQVRGDRVRAGRAAGHLVEQRRQPELAEPAGQLVQPGQLPRGFLVGGQRGGRRVRVLVEAGQRGHRGERVHLGRGVLPGLRERRVAGRQPRLAVARPGPGCPRRAGQPQCLPLGPGLLAQRPPLPEPGLLRVPQRGEQGQDRSLLRPGWPGGAGRFPRRRRTAGRSAAAASGWTAGPPGRRPRGPAPGRAARRRATASRPAAA